MINYEGKDMKKGAHNCIKEKISHKNMIPFSVYSVFTFVTAAQKQSKLVLLTHKTNVHFLNEIKMIARQQKSIKNVYTIQFFFK